MLLLPQSLRHKAGEGRVFTDSPSSIYPTRFALRLSDCGEIAAYYYEDVSVEGVAVQ
jgi:hypothetical protein